MSEENPTEEDPISNRQLSLNLILPLSLAVHPDKKVEQGEGKDKNQQPGDDGHRLLILSQNGGFLIDLVTLLFEDCHRRPAQPLNAFYRRPFRIPGIHPLGEVEEGAVFFSRMAVAIRLAAFCESPELIQTVKLSEIALIPGTEPLSGEV